MTNLIGLVFYFSIVHASSFTAKRLNLDGTKGKSISPYKGTIQRVEIQDLYGLKEWIVYLSTQFQMCIALGVSIFKYVNFVKRDNLALALKQNQLTISKTGEYLMYALSGIIYIDYDFCKMFPLYTFDQLVALVDELIPELIGCGKLLKYSSSAFVKRKIDNQYISDKRSMHLFILATEVTEVAILKLKALFENAMKAKGYVKHIDGKDVKILDMTSFSKQKPIFTSNPILEEGLVKDYYEPVVYDGVFLDLSKVNFNRYGEISNIKSSNNYRVNDVDFGNSNYCTSLGISLSQVSLENLAYFRSLTIKRLDLFDAIKPYLNNEIVALLLNFIGFKVSYDYKFKIRNETTASASLMRNGFINDFGDCGFKGDIFNLLQTQYKLNFKESIFYIADCLGVKYA